MTPSSRTGPPSCRGHAWAPRTRCAQLILMLMTNAYMTGEVVDVAGAPLRITPLERVSLP